jgi:hypothetical protein
MAVDFSREDFAGWLHQMQRQGRHQSDDEEIDRLFVDMVQANRPREIREALEAVNDAADLHGIEHVAPENNPNDDHLDYANTGESYNLTVGYDAREQRFILTSWGGWTEAALAQLHEEGIPANEGEAVCERCERVWPVDELEQDICERCRRAPTWPTWEPGDRPLIARLRSIGGPMIAVHYLAPDDYLSGLVYPRHTTEGIALAFSVEGLGGTFFASNSNAAVEPQSSPVIDSHFVSNVPFTNSWENLATAFSRKGMMDLYVTGIGRSRHDPDIGIEREQFSRLTVAMDAFLATGGTQQPYRAFLDPPPVLWACHEIDRVVWYEERGEATVDAYVGELSVWGTRSPDLEQLIEYGFIAWKNDGSVRSYLESIGVCRRERAERGN